MMKEKRKGLLQRGIMVAVSALTIVAGAGTVLAYEPMQSSDSSIKNAITSYGEVNYADFNNGFIDPLLIDFSKSNTVFIHMDGTQDVSDNFSVEPYALCTHSMKSGYFSTHSPNSSGGCTVRVYKAQRCEKCGYLANAVLYSTTTYPKCPH